MIDLQVGVNRLSRRRFLRAGLRAGAASLLAQQMFTPSLFAQSKLTPDEALKELMDGNARFVEGKLSSFDHDLAILKEHTVEKQQPFAAVLSCADSRVPVELIFDQSIGHVFVSRVAGNVITPEIIGSLEYGVAVLGTPVIVVLGHAGCGAVKAAMKGVDVPGEISSLFPHIQPAVDSDPSHDLVTTIQANAHIQADILRKASPVVSEMVSAGKLKVVAGYYDLASGKVTMV
jgi:carbonic anhydrase